MVEQSSNPFDHVKDSLEVDGKTYHFYNLTKLGDERLAKLPFSIRVLLESNIRNCDNFNIKRKSKISLTVLLYSCRHRDDLQLEGDVRERPGDSLQARQSTPPGLHGCASRRRSCCHEDRYARARKRPQQNQSPLLGRPRHRSLRPS